MCKIYKLILFSISLIWLVGCSNDNIVDSSIYYDECIVKIQYKDDLHLVKKSNDESHVYEYTVNGKHMKWIDTNYALRRYMTLVSTDDENNLSKNSKIHTNVFESSVESSSAYINYLINIGYTKVFEANTPKFVEIYMHNENSYKRIIVTSSYIVISDTNYIPEITIENYLFN